METNAIARKGRAIKIYLLRKLLREISDKDSNVLIRMDVGGQTTEPEFMKVMWLSDKGVLLQAQANKRFVAIEDIGSVREFEISDPFPGFHPLKRYEIHRDSI